MCVLCVTFIHCFFFCFVVEPARCGSCLVLIDDTNGMVLFLFLLGGGARPRLHGRGSSRAVQPCVQLPEVSVLVLCVPGSHPFGPRTAGSKSPHAFFFRVVLASCFLSNVCSLRSSCAGYNISAVLRTSVRRGDSGKPWHEFWLKLAFPNAKISETARYLTSFGGVKQDGPFGQKYPAAGHRGACCPVCRPDGSANSPW